MELADLDRILEASSGIGEDGDTTGICGLCLSQKIPSPSNKCLYEMASADLTAVICSAAQAALAGPSRMPFL